MFYGLDLPQTSCVGWPICFINERTAKTLYLLLTVQLLLKGALQQKPPFVFYADLQPHKGKPSARLPFGLWPPPFPRAANKTEGKRKVSTKTNHRNRQLCRQETLLSLHRIETSWLKLKEISFWDSDFYNFRIASKLRKINGKQQSEREMFVARSLSSNLFYHQFLAFSQNIRRVSSCS